MNVPTLLFADILNTENMLLSSERQHKKWFHKSSVYTPTLVIV